MFKLLRNYKVLWFFGILAAMLCSISVTLAFDDTISDSVSIIFSVLSGIALLIVMAALFVDAIEAICNP
nr:hypothetical protein [Acinetobacter sp. Marseille-Q1620]